MRKPSFGFSAYLHHSRFYPQKGMVWPAVLFLLSLCLGPLSGCSDAEETKRTATVSAPAASTPSATQLFTAAGRGDAEAVQRLLDAGVDVNATDPDGWTALMFAAHRGDNEVVTLLLDAGAEVNTESQDGSTPLMAAALSGHLDVVEVLINAGANVSVTNKIGVTALAIAQQDGHTEIAKLLAPRIRPTQEEVVETQRLLTELGYGPGPIDGIYGPQTAGAIRAYQQDAGLPVDGTISENLIAHASDSLEQQRLAEQQNLADQEAQAEQGG